jgi:MoaD family protein
LATHIQTACLHPQQFKSAPAISLIVVRLQVSVRFFTALREITGKREETLTFKNAKDATIDNVLSKLAKRYGKSFADYVYDQRTGEAKGFLQFLVNGRSASASSSLETKLADGDVLAIIPPVGGG